MRMTRLGKFTALDPSRGREWHRVHEIEEKTDAYWLLHGLDLRRDRGRLW